MKYNIIYADPPWPYRDDGAAGTYKAHYKAMNLEAILKLPVQQICENDCILFLWSTFPMLQEALITMSNWGFNYKTVGFNWVKLTKSRRRLHYGTGHYTRANSEVCLIGIKGNLIIQNHDVRQVIMTPVSRHSEKPNEVRERIVKLVGDLPRVELFARQKVDGWDSWGNEIESDFEFLN